MDSPARQRSFPSITARKPSGVSLPRPTSTSVPTMARTMLRKKRSAWISKRHSPGGKLRPTGLHDTAVVGLRIGIHFAETGEIGIIEQCSSSFVHLPKIKHLVQTAGISPQERGLAEMQVIMVGARQGSKRACASLPQQRLVNGDIRRQQAVELVRQPPSVNPSHRVIGILEIEMSHHHPGVYSGIRPSRSCDGHGLPQEGGQGFLQHLLHTDTVGLNLPTVVTRAVIGQNIKNIFASV